MVNRDVDSFRKSLLCNKKYVRNMPRCAVNYDTLVMSMSKKRNMAWDGDMIWHFCL